MYEIRSLTIQHTVDPEHLVIFKNLMDKEVLDQLLILYLKKTTFLASSFTNLTSLQDIVSVKLLSHLSFTLLIVLKSFI